MKTAARPLLSAGVVAYDNGVPSEHISRFRNKHPRRMVQTTSARWWHRQGEQAVCTLCPRECAMHDGQRGFCFVRQNVGGEVQLTTYGRSTGFCIDPIEKKPLNHFLPGTPVLSFGTAGCNLGCKFCQNWSISKSREIDDLADEATPEAIAQAALKHGCRSVAFTYNDPVIWAEYAIDTARACRAVGIKTVAVTAGYVSREARPEFYAEMDAANVDLKGFTEDFYRHVTLSHLEPVLETLKWLKHESDVWFEITNLMIPGENDSEDETRKMCDWIVDNLGPDVPVHFTAFHPDFRMRDVSHTPPATLARAREIALQAGIHFPYVGNVHDLEGQSTYCPNCRECLVERNWYQLGRWRLEGSQCARCGTTIPGVFEDRPGNWGPKRQPVRIAPVLVPLSIPPVSAASTPAAAGAAVSQVQNVASSVPSPTDPPPTAMTPKIDFSDEDVGLLLGHVRALADAVLQDDDLPVLPDHLDQAQAYGMFVTFKRQDELRGCRGRFGAVQPLGTLLAEVVADTLQDDPRFPAVTAEELPFLNFDVSLMHNPLTVRGTPSERIAAVTVGKHGVLLTHPRGRGLLLPQVATEHHWNSYQFLQAVSQKSGLPTMAWSDPDASLMIFEARILEAPALVSEPDLNELTAGDFERMREIVEAVAARGSLSAEGVSQRLHTPVPSDFGVAVQTQGGKIVASMGNDQSLAELVARIAQSFINDPEVRRIDRITVFSRPLELRPVDHPQRHGSVSRSAIMVRQGPRWTIQFPTGATGNPISSALQGVGLSLDDWRGEGGIKVTAFSTVRAESLPSRGDKVRPPARAGQFYPAAPAQVQADVKRFLAAGSGPARPCRAIMLPHAGWIFCGEIIGKTLSRTEVPRTVVILSPKHTPDGPDWSVSSAGAWAYPGGEVPVATELRSQLVSMVPGLEVEADAHRQEHGVEVLIPFLHARQPNLRIVPIVLGPTAYSQTERLARALSVLVAESSEPILLVISSDMNHFAPEPENRRRDLMAAEAFCTGDPGRLFDVVTQNQISMCGIIPAVTVLRALQASDTPPRPQLVDYANSAAVSGDFQRVVGYAGCVVE